MSKKTPSKKTPVRYAHAALTTSQQDFLKQAFTTEKITQDIFPDILKKARPRDPILGGLTQRDELTVTEDNDTFASVNVSPNTNMQSSPALSRSITRNSDSFGKNTNVFEIITPAVALRKQREKIVNELQVLERSFEHKRTCLKMGNTSENSYTLHPAMEQTNLR